jgi:hypothetical protein
LCGTDLSGISVIECYDGGYLVAGYSNCNNTDYDMMILKTDRNGDSLWSRTFGGAGADFLSAAAQLPDSGFIVFGHSNSYGNGFDIIIMRLNSAGDSIWQKQFGGTDDEKVQHGIRCRDGGFALTGSTRSYGAGNEDLFILRTDSAGNLITKVEQPDSRPVFLSPNPFTSSVRIAGSEQIQKIDILNLTGQMIHEYRVMQKEAEIRTEDLPPGIYLCRIEFVNGKNSVRKIVKVASR